MALFILCVVVLTGITIVFAVRLNGSLHSMRPPQGNSPSDRHLPSVSVCIPARNEMHAMAQCLDRVLASDYQKLEVIVFDDSSADDTSLLVRSYAHAGVRFVPGTSLPEGWLGKNHALDVLASEASGKLLVFLDVDTAIEPDTITRLAHCAVDKKLDMLSVIPARRDAWRASVLLGTLRYFWQLVATTRRTPATASSLWMINAKALEAAGGFSMLKATVQPETYMAVLLGDRYHCYISENILGVSYEKKWRSQIETSRRLLFPATGGVWWKALGALLILLFLNVPTFALLFAFVFGWSEWQVGALWFLLVHMALYGLYTSHVWHRNWWLGGLLWPVVVFQELVVFMLSIIGYSRHTITWKGRSIITSSARVDL